MKKIIIALGILLLATPLFASTRQKIPLIPTDAAITMTAAKTLTVTGDATISASPYTPSGTDVAVVDGGTGLSTIADGSVLATNAADTLSAITWHDAGTKILTNASGTISWETAGAGSGDITSVGDVADGAAFDGTQGTTLTFNNIGGDATLAYDGSTFTFNKFITSSLTGAVTGIASGNALPALSNLASVACNLSLVSDTANTDDLGTEAIFWKKLYLSSDISFEGATDNDYQTTLTAVDTTVADKTINIPNADGTMAVSATAPLALSALGNLTIPQATTSVDGYVVQADWDSWTDHVADNTQAHSDYFINTGDIAGAGTYDFGSANVVLEIPNAAAPTTDATGEMAIDTNLITQGMLQVYLTSAIANVVATTDTPGDNEVPTYDSAGGTIQWEALPAASGTVTNAGNLTDNLVVRGDGGTVGVQTSTVSISDAGEMTNTSQPAFEVQPTSSQDDIAAGSAVTIVFGTEIFDQGGDFASNTFTAPVTGKYQFNFMTYLANIDAAATDLEISIITSNRTFLFCIEPPKFLTADGYSSFAFSAFTDMDASDTCYMTIRQYGGSNQMDILQTPRTYFSGFLAN